MLKSADLLEHKFYTADYYATVHIIFKIQPHTQHRQKPSTETALLQPHLNDLFLRTEGHILLTRKVPSTWVSVSVMLKLKIKQTLNSMCVCLVRI